MRIALLLFTLLTTTGCAAGGPSADVEPGGWCRVSVTNESGRGLKLLYYRVLGYPRDTPSRTLVARTGDIRLDPERRVRGVLRPAR
ncbi:MAG: hypothetical protein R6U63_04240 [Longimicrobiales bacterium]